MTEWNLLARFKNAPFFPLAKLSALGILTGAAAIGALYICNTDGYPNGWAGVCFVPLIVYLGYCQYRARNMILAEQGREREIVRMGFVAMAADRAARFWGINFSAVAIATCLVSVAIWGYQGFLWYRESHWIPQTWLSIGGNIPSSGSMNLQRLFYWLGDTNIGVIALISGLLIAAPLAAISWRSNNKAKFRRNELRNLKKRS
jgi:hypothetical protein